MRVRDAGALRAYVRLMGLSERALAARAGVGHATVNHLLSGRRSGCSERTARAIEAVLECPPGLFFDAESAAVGPGGPMESSAAEAATGDVLESARAPR
jgi:transcriptional regulator with XRE-family HTH domain